MKNLITFVATIGLLGMLFGCGGGGGDATGNACSDLNIKVYGGDQCRFEKSPVVPLYALSADGVPLGTCSGTLVTLDDVLTAAHCIELTRVPGAVGVFVYADQKLIPLVRGYNHPYYNGEVASPFDIAMVTMAEPVQISPVPLLLSDPSTPGERISVFGYGLNEDPQNSPEDLKAAYMTISEMWPGGFAANFDDSNTSICNGDSGGPVTQTVNGITGLIGVNSFALNGCREDSLSGFVDIQYQLIYDFILAYAQDVAVT